MRTTCLAMILLLAASTLTPIAAFTSKQVVCPTKIQQASLKSLTRLPSGSRMWQARFTSMLRGQRLDRQLPDTTATCTVTYPKGEHAGEHPLTILFQ